MTDFSSEHAPPRRRFRPGPGQVGQHAGLQATKQPAAGGSRPAARGGEGRGRPNLGLPNTPPPQAPSGEEAPPTDHRHLVAAAQYANMKDLGRDSPFGVWFINNGHFRQLFEPGQVPYDWFQHGA